MTTHPIVSGLLALVAVAGVCWLLLFVYGKFTGEKKDAKRKSLGGEDGGCGSGDSGGGGD